MSDKKAFSRRKALKSFGATAASVSLAGCSSLPFGKNKLQKEIGEIKEKFSKYDGNLKKAMEDGYTAIQGPFVPNMGWHVSNPKLIKKHAKEGMDRLEPEILVYDDKMNLGAVEYGVPSNAVSTAPDLYSDSNSKYTENWTTHPKATHVFADGNGKQDSPKKFKPEDWLTPKYWTETIPPQPKLKPGDKFNGKWGGIMKGKDAKGTGERVIDVAFTHPELLTLHVWWDNPEGPFNPTNPNFANL